MPPLKGSCVPKGHKLPAGILKKVRFIWVMKSGRRILKVNGKVIFLVKKPG